MKPTISLRKALTDPFLLGDVLGSDTWRSWRILLIGAMGETLTPDERTIFRKMTGRRCEPGERVEELIGIIGRRGGKSRAVATLAAYIGGLCDHRDVLAPGENAVLLCISPDQRQARITLDYATAAFEHAPILRQLIAGRTTDTLSLANGISIEVRAASFRRLRGPTYIAVIADEAAYYYTDESSSNADTEILNAVRPGLATTGGLLAIISSPYAKRGELWETYRRHYGPDGDPLILVAQAASRDMNPSLPASIVNRALERDHAAARAEYLGEFRSDIGSYISREAVAAVVSVGVRERAPVGGIHYVAFCDPSGGSADAFTLAIAHRQDGVAILDAIRERTPPFSPEHVIEEFAGLLKDYRISEVAGDRYGGEFPRELFRKRGITYRLAAKPRSDLYQALLPVINSRLVDFLDNDRLITQLVSLERRTARGGKDSIDHRPGGHDDVANAVAGAFGLIFAEAVADYDSSMAWVRDIASSPRFGNPYVARPRFPRS